MTLRRSHRPAGITPVASAVLRTLAMCAPAALASAPPALAEAADVKPLATGLAAQPLEQALEKLARDTGVQILYVSEVLGSKVSQPVPPGLDLGETLARMLRGTGLTFEYLTPHSVRIVMAAAGPVAVVGLESAPVDALQEVIVTASRWTEKLQDVPISVQVLSGEQLQEYALDTFNDLNKYTANVSYSGNGPGTGNIFIRGLGSPGMGNQSQGIVGPFPNVALYLDEQAMQFPTRNNDVYMIDLERIEVLEGPQGTLYGGGAEAGAIRYITSKPRIGDTHAEINVGYGVTTGGAPNSAANAIFNLPLIDGKLAVRVVGFYDRRGGYISNVPGTISFDFPSATPGGSRQVSPVATNAGLLGSNTNSLTYSGFRLSGLYRFSDAWDLLIQQSGQWMQTDGYFYAYPFDPNGRALQPNQITAFTPAFNNDSFNSTAWIVNGRIGELRAIYAGSYMNRHIDAQQDYSNYLRYAGGSYYDCIGPGAGYFNELTFPDQLADKPLRCYAPVGSWHDDIRNEHQSQEVRLNTPQEQRIRALFGAYWESFVIDDQVDFNYLGIPQCSSENLANALAGGAACLSAVGPLPGTYARDPALRVNIKNAFGDDVQRGYDQYAFFASIDFDLVPKVLILTAGTRFYQYDDFEKGSTWYSLTSDPLVLNHPNGACTVAGYSCGIPLNLDKKESGFRSRLNLTWHIDPDLMVFYTYSEGFRPGGFNRTASLPGYPPYQDGVARYCGGATSIDPRCWPGGSLYQVPGGTAQMLKPYSYSSDNLINNELGLKGEFLRHRMRVNATAYLMHWNNVQSVGYATALQSFTDVVNGPSYTAKGLELQLMARTTERLLLEGVASWNSSQQTRLPCLRSSGITDFTPNNPTPKGDCITIVAGQPFALGAHESSIPYAPPVMFNLRARYDWQAGPYRPSIWIGVSHTGATSNEPKNFPDGNAPTPIGSTALRYTIPAYTVVDAGVVVDSDHWRMAFTGTNLANSNAPTNISSGQFIKANIPMRPCVLMLRIGYSF